MKEMLSKYFSIKAVYKDITVGQSMGCVGEELWGHEFDVTITSTCCLWRICSPLPHFLLYDIKVVMLTSCLLCGRFLLNATHFL